MKRNRRMMNDERGVSLLEYTVVLGILGAVFILGGKLVVDAANHRVDVSEKVVKGFVPCGPESYLNAAANECF